MEEISGRKASRVKVPNSALAFRLEVELSDNRRKIKLSRKVQIFFTFINSVLFFGHYLIA
jgi:hypothetical protein